MPLAGRREITVYDRVIVGSDGSPSALYAVSRAHEVASAAEARVVVVSAYDPDDTGQPHDPVDGRRLLYGQQAARAAVHRSVREITSERVRDIESVVVAGKPADTLLEVPAPARLGEPSSRGARGVSRRRRAVRFAGRRFGRAPFRNG